MICGILATMKKITNNSTQKGSYLKETLIEFLIKTSSQ